MSDVAISAALCTENKTRCDPPLPEAEVVMIASNIKRYPPVMPEHVQRGTEVSMTKKNFPLEALPVSLRRYCIEQSQALPCPVDLVALATLGVASAAIGRSRLIQLKQGWLEPAGLFVAIVAPPGCLKSPVLKHASEPIRSKQEEWRKEYEETKKRHEDDLLNYQKSADAFKKGKGAHPGEKPEVPCMRRLWTADVTVERLGTLLAENPRGLLLLRDELSAWVRGLNQYRQGRGADRQFYLSAWSQAPTAIDRQQKDPIFVDRPH